VGVRLLDARLRGALVEARIPFRFGIAEMNEIVHVFLFATMEIDGEREIGIAADNLPPKWFTKNPATTYPEDVSEMIGVIESACALARRGGSKDSVFDLWYDVHCEATRCSSGVSPLLTTFGVSLVERAAIDAFCRAKRIPFAQAVRRNDLGIRLGRLHPALSRREPREFLPRRAMTRMTVRHTVGLGDPLCTGDEQGGLRDDLPSTLEACIRHYGLRRFKLKVSGNRRADLERLERVGRVLDGQTRGDYRVTIDGNEQFDGVSALRAFWDDLTEWHGTSELGRRVDYVEQPLPRDLALSASTSAELAAWPGRPRLIIDESDDSLDAVTRAIEAGYDGGAFKSSKGVFKGIANACRVEQLRREDASKTLIYSGEDSSTIGPVGLLADLAVIATLGIDEPERNGHHYLRGLTGLPSRVQRETIRVHGDLFSPRADAYPALNIQCGRIHVGSVVAAAFGVGWPLAMLSSTHEGTIPIPSFYR
jgi:hypothetical protein